MLHRNRGVLSLNNYEVLSFHSKSRQTWREDAEKSKHDTKISARKTNGVDTCNFEGILPQG